MGDVAKLMLYDEPDQGKKVFYLLDVDPVDVLSVFHKDLRITAIKFVASDLDGIFYPTDIGDKETLKDFLKEFADRPGRYIDSLEMTLEDGSEISVHDGNEVNLVLSQNELSDLIIADLLEKLGYSAARLLNKLKKYPNEYLQVKQPDCVEERYPTFDDYLNKM